MVWPAFERGAQTSDAAAILCEAYGISKAQGLADADAIFQHWVGLGLLDVSQNAESISEDAARSPKFDLGPKRLITFRIRASYFRVSIAEMSVAKHLEGLLASFIVDNQFEAGSSAVYDFAVSHECGAMLFRVDGEERI